MGEHGELILQNPQYRAALGTGDAGTQKLLQRHHPIAVHTPPRMRQLVDVSAMLDDQSLFDQRHRKITGDAQPEVVVFANRQRLVEATAALE